MPSKNFVDYLPVYSRMLDDRGVLEHFATALQSGIDESLKALELAETIFDPQNCPPEWIHYMAQTVGLSNYEEHWLGVGLNPVWADWYKRDVIQRYSEYSRRKGSEWAIREAISLWLLWDVAHDRKRLDIRLPMGDRLTRDLPQYSLPRTMYGSHAVQTFAERRSVGGLDQSYNAVEGYSKLKGNSSSLFGGSWSDRRLVLEKRGRYTSDGNAMATQRPRMHFNLTKDEWAYIFPNILKLNAEIWNTFASPYCYGWLNYVAKTKRIELSSELINTDIEIAPITGLPTAYQTKKIAVIDGSRWGDRWHGPGRFPAKSIETVEQGFIQVSPGHRFGDRWHGQPLKKGMLYRPLKLAVTYTKTEAVPAIKSCRTFEQTKIKTGETLTPYVPSFVPASAHLTKLNAITLPSFNVPYKSQVRVHLVAVVPWQAVLPQDQFVQAPQAIAIQAPVVPSVVFVASVTVPVASTSLTTTSRVATSKVIPFPAQYPIVAGPMSNLSIKAKSIPFTANRLEQFVFKPPTHCHAFGQSWGSNRKYYRPKFDTNASTSNGGVVVTPILNIIQFCNFKSYSTRRIKSFHNQRDPIGSELTLFQTYPIFEDVSDSRNWDLSIQADRLYLLRPVTMFWAKLVNGEMVDRSKRPDITSGRLNLYLEFLIDLPKTIQAEKFSLKLKGETVVCDRFDLTLAQGTCFGLKFLVPLRFGSGANNLSDDLTIKSIMPPLLGKLGILQQTIPIVITPTTGSSNGIIPIVPQPITPITDLSLEDLLNRTENTMQTIIESLADLNAQSSLDNDIKFTQADLVDGIFRPSLTLLGKPSGVTVYDQNGQEVDVSFRIIGGQVVVDLLDFTPLIGEWTLSASN